MRNLHPQGYLLLCLFLVLTFVLPPSTVAHAAPPGDDRFGICWINQPGAAASTLRISQAYSTGARWDRFPVYWPSVQPNADSPMDWSGYDNWVNTDLANGIQPQLILLATPGWAESNGAPHNLSAPPADNPWYQFVYQAALRYRGKVKYYEIWNEPDLGTVFWSGSLPDFVQLVRVGYRAVKDADPSAQVILSGLSLPYDNRDWFDRFIAEMMKDPHAKANNYYFDIVALHLYSRSADIYEYVVGNMEWVGLRNIIKNRLGQDKPIWINESGAPIWIEGGDKSPGTSTADEAGAYVIQAFAYGLAANLGKIFFFQLYDDGVGNRDGKGRLQDSYGMFSNPEVPGTAGRPRATYTAYQIANTYMAGAKVATRVNLNRTQTRTGKGIDIVTLYGARSGKVSVAWNNDGSRPQQARIPASTQNAVVIDQRGNQRVVKSVNGYYTLDLLAATNNNNFSCFTSRGCDPSDYVIGGEPLLLVELEPLTPVATINPIATSGAAPFWLSWKPVAGVAGADRVKSYDVQWMDTAENVWRDWLTMTTTTSAMFGYGSPIVAQQYRTYLFRVRARDGAGNLLGDYPVAPQASMYVTGGRAITNPPAKTYTVAAQFSDYYNRYDGIRILGRPLSELQDGGGGMVQYFEKGRLEDHSARVSDPNWRYMYGLLAEDLLNAKSNIPIGGETSTISYAQVDRQQSSPPPNYRGGVAQNSDGSVFIPYNATLAPANGYTVPALFWNYINDPKLFPGGWLHNIGLPAGPAMPAIVNKAGIGERWIVVQVFQRTVLTYDPRNPPGWQVERANIGSDYYKAFPNRLQR